MKQLLRQYAIRFKKNDFFFTIELFGTVLRGSLIATDPTTKRGVVLASTLKTVASRPREAFVEDIPALMKEFSLPVSVRVVALLDHRRASIITDNISLLRSDPKAEIKQAELENLVAQGLWKLVGAGRARAAKHMEIPEVRVRLADADVVQVQLNGHRVVNPIGFAARSVELSCRETFVDEALLSKLTAALTEDNLTAVVEAPAVLAGLVARLHPRDSFLFISVGAQESVIYTVQQMALTYTDSFTWGTQTLIGGVAKHFLLDVVQTQQLLHRYARQEISPAVRRAVEAAASGELAILSNGIAAHQPAGQPLPVYVHADLPLPEFLFNSAFTKKLGLNLTLTAVNKDFIGAHTGFVVELQQQTEINNAYTFDAVLAVIAELSAASAAPIVSKTAKQRARWIRAAGGGDASL